MKDQAKRFLELQDHSARLSHMEKSCQDPGRLQGIRERKRVIEAEMGILDKELDLLAEQHLKQRLKENPKEWASVIAQEAATCEEAIRYLAKGVFLLEQIRYPGVDEIKMRLWPERERSKKHLRDFRKFHAELERLHTENPEPLYIRKSRLFQERLSLDNPSLWENFKTRYINKALAAAKG